MAQWRRQLSPAAAGFSIAFGLTGLVVAVIPWFVFSIGPPGPGEIDAGGMAVAAILIVGIMQAAICLMVGLPAWAGAAVMRRES